MNRIFHLSARPLVQGLLPALLLAALPARAADPYLYWTNQFGPSISRFNLINGTSDDPWLTLTAAAMPTGIATDGTNVYWTEPGLHRIGRAAIASALTPRPATSDEENWISGLAAPHGVTVDPAGTTLYWSDPDGVPNTILSVAYIGKVDLTGTYVAKSANDAWWAYPTVTPVDNISAPPGMVAPFILYGGFEGLTVDNTYIYWADTTAGAIKQATLGTVVAPLFDIDDPSGPIITDGGSNDAAVVVTGLNAPSDVRVNATNLYYADYNSGATGTSYVGMVALPALPIVTPAADAPLVTGLTGDPALALKGANLFWADNLTDSVKIFEGTLAGTSSRSLATAESFVGAMAVGADAPLVVSVASFTAQAKASQVVVSWTTGSEVNTAGFNVLRSTTANGSYAKVNPALIPAQGLGVAGASYSLTDAGVAAGQTWFYELQDIDNTGVSTLHGPVSATVGAASLILSFQATPPDVFLGGSTLLAWNTSGSPALTLTGAGAVSGGSLKVTPLGTTGYTLADAQGDQSLATVTVKPFGFQDIAGLSLAWGSSIGDANYNPCYDLDCDGTVGDLDVKACLAGL